MVVEVKINNKVDIP